MSAGIVGDAFFAAVCPDDCFGSAKEFARTISFPLSLRQRAIDVKETRAGAECIFFATVLTETPKMTWLRVSRINVGKKHGVYPEAVYVVLGQEFFNLPQR